MYNQSPSNDLIYYGDSFENSDKVDITKCFCAPCDDCKAGSSCSYCFGCPTCDPDHFYHEGDLNDNYEH